MKQGKLIPYIIIGAFVGFGVFVGSFIFKATQKSVNLVQKDYYQKELEYDTHIAVLKRSRAFDKTVNLHQENEFLKFNVPSEFMNSEAEIHFYRPSDHKLDERQMIILEKEDYTLNLSRLDRGEWKVILSISAKEDYVFELPLSL